MRKKKIKILHVAQAAGGVDRYIRMLLKYLDKEKFENILVCSQDFNREDYDGLVDSFEQIEMNRAIGVSDLNSIKEVRRLIKKYNPDIVYAHSSKAGAIARVADIGLKNHCVSMHIRAAFIIASEAIYSPSAEYKRVPDKIINKAKQWSEQYPKKIEFQEAYFGLLFSRLKYAQAQDMRNEQRRVYREMKTVAERANYSEYNESNQLMESVDILHRVFGY